MNLASINFFQNGFRIFLFVFLFLVFGGNIDLRGEDVILKGVKFSEEEIDKAYQGIKKKYLLHPQLKAVKSIVSRGMRKRGIKWREGKVISKFGSFLILDNGGEFFAMKVSNANMHELGKTEGFLTWGNGKYMYNSRDQEIGRISIPQYTDITLYPQRFMQEINRGFEFKRIDWFYKKLNREGGDVEETRRQLYQKEQKERANNLVKDARITVSGSRDEKRNSPDLLHDNKEGTSIKNCWVSDTKKEIFFSWDEPQRAGKIYICSGYKSGKKKTYQYITSGFDLYYEKEGEWKILPGGKYRVNTEPKLECTLHPTAFRKLRLNLYNDTSSHAFISEVKIWEWEKGKKPAPPVSLGARRYTEAELRNAHKLIAGKYGLKTNGTKPVPISILIEKSPKKRKVRVISGNIVALKGARDIKVGKTGWIIMRHHHPYKVGQYVKFIAQLSTTRTVVQGKQSGVKDTERRYVDLNIHYKEFIHLLKRGWRVPELKDML